MQSILHLREESGTPGNWRILILLGGEGSISVRKTVKHSKTRTNQQNTAKAAPGGGDRKRQKKKRRGHLVDAILILAVLIGAGLLARTGGMTFISRGRSRATSSRWRICRRRRTTRYGKKRRHIIRS